jgi:hypothetical protein
MHAYALELLLDRLQPGARVLDVGSGTGWVGRRGCCRWHARYARKRLTVRTQAHALIPPHTPPCFPAAAT